MVGSPAPGALHGAVHGATRGAAERGAGMLGGRELLDAGLVIDLELRGLSNVCL